MHFKAEISLKSRVSARWRALLEESSFIREYLWKYRRWVGVGLLALVIVDILEVFPPLLLKGTVDVVVERKPLKQLGWLAAAYLGTSLLQALCRYGWRMYLIRASMFAGRDLRGRLSGHLFGLSSSFFDRTRIGNLMSLATSDVEAVRMEIGSGILVFADAMFYFLTVPAAMLYLSPRLTLIALLPLPIIPWLVMRNEREVHCRFERVQESLGELSAMVQEGLAGVRVIKAFAKEEIQVSRFRKKGEDFVRLNLHLSRVQSAFGPTLDFAMSAGMVVLLFVGGYDLIRGGSGAAGAVTLGTFVAFQRYVQKMVWPMAAIGMAMTMYQRAVSSSNRLKSVLSEQTDVPEPVRPMLPGGIDPETVRSAIPRWRTPGGVEFRNLRFRFPGSDQEVLKGISLKIEPGQRVAFIGTIGAGKSALLSLLPRLYPVNRGMLFIDGVDINDWPTDELRRQVGYVSQDVFLFSETISENIAFGLQEWAAAEIEEASALAAVHEDVIGLEGSYKTRLGERGVNLSGGQKQRLSIARALVKQPAILVLDDALSSVDVRTEEKILEGLRSRKNRNTEMIAAHRISTVRDADQIVVIEGGSVRQQGTHASLMAERRGAYRRFYEEQERKEDLEQYVESLGAGE